MSHERIAGTFDEWVASGKAEGLEEDHSDVVWQVIPRMGIRPGMQSLDLGCGTGWATRLLASAAPGAGAVGIDVSGSMIAKAEEGHDLTSRARYERGTFEALDFPDGRFDRVFSMEAVYYAVDLDAALSEVFRVLKPGGEAHLVLNYFEEVPASESWPPIVGLDLRRLSEAEWRAALERAGFSPVESERVLDSRGPGSEADFTPSTHAPDRATQLALYEAGSLWVRGTKPA